MDDYSVSEDLWEVAVSNEETNETTSYYIIAGHPYEATVLALQRAFKSLGWRKCSAHPDKARQLAMEWVA